MTNATDYNTDRDNGKNADTWKSIGDIAKRLIGAKK